MNENGKNKNILIVAAILVVLGVAGYFYATRDRTGDALLTATDFSTSTSAVDGDLLTALRQLKQLKLDASIFSNPVWESLTDFSSAIPPQPAGRPNPFLPLDGVSSSATSTR